MNIVCTVCGWVAGGIAASYELDVTLVQFASLLAPTEPYAVSFLTKGAYDTDRGIVFIFSMDAFKSPTTKAMTASLLGLAGLTVISIVLAATLRESPVQGS